MENLWTARDVAEYLGINLPMVYYHIKENGLPTVGRIGNNKRSAMRFSKKAIDEWMKQNQDQE